MSETDIARDTGIQYHVVDLTSRRVADLEPTPWVDVPERDCLQLCIRRREGKPYAILRIDTRRIEATTPTAREVLEVSGETIAAALNLHRGRRRVRDLQGSDFELARLVSFEVGPVEDVPRYDPVSLVVDFGNTFSMVSYIAGSEVKPLELVDRHYPEVDGNGELVRSMMVPTELLFERAEGPLVSSPSAADDDDSAPDSDTVGVPNAPAPKVLIGETARLRAHATGARRNRSYFVNLKRQLFHERSPHERALRQVRDIAGQPLRYQREAVGPEDVSRYFFRELFLAAHEALNRSQTGLTPVQIKEIFFTVPVTFTRHEIDMLEERARQAVELAGLWYHRPPSGDQGELPAPEPPEVQTRCDESTAVAHFVLHSLYRLQKKAHQSRVPGDTDTHRAANGGEDLRPNEQLIFEEMVHRHARHPREIYYSSEPGQAVDGVTERQATALRMMVLDCGGGSTDISIADYFWDDAHNGVVSAIHHVDGVMFGGDDFTVELIQELVHRVHSQVDRETADGSRDLIDAWFPHLNLDFGARSIGSRVLIRQALFSSFHRLADALKKQHSRGHTRAGVELRLDDAFIDMPGELLFSRDPFEDIDFRPVFVRGRFYDATGAIVRCRVEPTDLVTWLSKTPRLDRNLGYWRDLLGDEFANLLPRDVEGRPIRPDILVLSGLTSRLPEVYERLRSMPELDGVKVLSLSSWPEAERLWRQRNLDKAAVSMGAGLLVASEDSRADFRFTVHRRPPFPRNLFIGPPFKIAVKVEDLESGEGSESPARGQTDSGHTFSYEWTGRRALVMGSFGRGPVWRNPAPRTLVGVLEPVAPKSKDLEQRSVTCTFRVDRAQPTRLEFVGAEYTDEPDDDGAPPPEVQFLHKADDEGDSAERPDFIGQGIAIRDITVESPQEPGSTP